MRIPRHRFLLSAALLSLTPPLVAQTCTETSWRPADPAPPARLGAALVFDAARERLVMFGGQHWHQSTHLGANDTWDWDGSLAQWQRRFPTTKPSPRDSHATAYDPVRQKIVLFGGANMQGQELGDTWEFDCITGQWQQLSPSSSPAARQGAAMVFDSLSGHTLMLGGVGPSAGIGSELWQWNGAAATWTLRPQVNAPTPRSFAPLAAESAPGRFLLFGGLDDGVAPQTNNDTWRFDSSSNTWTLLAPATRPGRRCAHTLVSDPLHQRIVCFGGDSFGEGILHDTWEWVESSHNWVQRQPDTAPQARQFAAGAWDGLTGHPVIYGGFSANSVTLGDLWEWNSEKGEWSLSHQPDGPSPALNQSMAYDSARRRVVLLSGSATPALMWEWDGMRWHSLGEASQVPSIAPLAFDGSRVIAAFSAAGQPGLQTWAWSGQSWSRLADCPAVDAGSVDLAFDSSRGRVVLFAGASRETWEWNGSVWALRFTGGPSSRTRFAMTFDSVRGQTILHGGEGPSTPSGITLLHDTWVWNGTQWTNAATADPSVDHALTFDPRRGVSIMVNATGTFEWTGLGPWTTIAPPGRITRRWADMSYHEAAGHLVIFGGAALNPTAIDHTERTTLIRGCTCYANCDNSTTAPRLTANDFTCFLSRFAAADPAANCDSSTGTPALTPADFLCFINHFAAGCP